VFLRKISFVLDKFARFISMSTLLLIFIIVFVSAVLRYAFELNILSSYDWVRVMFVWFCFLGLSVVYREKNHSNFTFIIDRLKGKVSLINNKMLNVIAFLFFIIVAYSGLVLANATKLQKLPASGISAFWLYFPICIGAAISSIHALCFILLKNVSFEQKE